MSVGTAERTTDMKAGFCGRCRNGDHALCASPPDRCTCPAKGHPNRPSGRVEPRPAAGQMDDVKARARASSAPAPGKATKTAPVWELVKAAPPPNPKKQSPAELAQPMLEAIAEAGGTDWWRIALFGTPHAAGRVKAVLVAEFSEGWEWKSARDEEGRPAVFVRRVEA